MKLREERLRKKGWSDEEINHAKNVIAKADQEKSRSKKIIEEIVLWILLTVVAASSLIGAWIAQPILLLLSAHQAIIALSVTGIIFGLFAGWIIAELEEMEAHHHLFMTISVPLIAIGSAILISNRIQTIIAASPAFASVQHNPLILAITYAASTTIPYSIILYLEKKRYETS